MYRQNIKRKVINLNNLIPYQTQLCDIIGKYEILMKVKNTKY